MSIGVGCDGPELGGRSPLIRANAPTVASRREPTGRSSPSTIGIAGRIGRWLYFAALSGPRLYRVGITALSDRSLPTTALGEAVETVCDVPAVSGISHGPDGSIYLSALTENAILRVDANRTVRTYVQDERLNSPNEGSIRNGWLYVPASQTNGLPMFHGGVSTEAAILHFSSAPAVSRSER